MTKAILAKIISTKTIFGLEEGHFGEDSLDEDHFVGDNFDEDNFVGENFDEDPDRRGQFVTKTLTEEVNL